MMLPTTYSDKDDLVNDFDIITGEDMPTYTYRLRPAADRVQGFSDGLEAMRQAVFKILQTERYQYPCIYSANYGVELWDLIGQPIPYVLPEIQRRVTEALLWDERIESVDSFGFQVQKSRVLAAFTVHTIFGDIEAEKAVSY